MMYTNKVVACLKVNGKILREQGDLVTLPFGSEYSILVKNLNSVRTQVKISVDGHDATGDIKLVLEPNSSIELERFISNGNMNSGNRFKFIERTEDVEAHRGIGAEDGIIRIESWNEKVVKYTYYPYNWTTSNHSNVNVNDPADIFVGDLTRSLSVNNLSFGGPAMNCAVNDSGITVAGGISSQKFSYVAGFELESHSTVIVLRLRGEITGIPVTAPITVETKIYCPTCGRSNSSRDRYCSRCGTAVMSVTA